MKIQAYMPVRDEVGILPFVLEHLESQGVAVHILDGWSTDGSYEMAIRLQHGGHAITVERFPEPSDDGIWNCRRTLCRISDLAASSQADWCMLTDADEWRFSPRDPETLMQGIARVDSEGWNAIDHRVFVFLPTDNEWTPSENPSRYFHHYTDNPCIDMLCGIPQVKTWKNLGSVDLVSSGGHDARFPERRLCPETFVLKHYPFRTTDQARRKLKERLTRRCHEEHQNGWGIHYDLFEPGSIFQWDQKALKMWPDLETPIP